MESKQLISKLPEVESLFPSTANCLGPVFENDPTAHVAMMLNEILFQYPKVAKKMFYNRIPCDISIENIDKECFVVGVHDDLASVSVLSMINTTLLACGYDRVAAMGIPSPDGSNLLVITSFCPLKEAKESTKLLTENEDLKWVDECIKEFRKRLGITKEANAN